MNANVGQILRPNLTLLKGEGDCAFCQGRLRVAGQTNPLSTIPLPNSLGGLWRRWQGISYS